MRLEGRRRAGGSPPPCHPLRSRSRRRGRRGRRRGRHVFAGRGGRRHQGGPGKGGSVRPFCAVESTRGDRRVGGGHGGRRQSRACVEGEEEEEGGRGRDVVDDLPPLSFEDPPSLQLPGRGVTELSEKIAQVRFGIEKAERDCDRDFDGVGSSPRGRQAPGGEAHTGYRKRRGKCEAATR